MAKHSAAMFALDMAALCLAMAPNPNIESVTQHWIGARTSMRIAVLTSGTGWHMRDLQRAARDVGCTLETGSWRRLLGLVALPGGEGIVGAESNLLNVDRVLLRTIPSGSLEQIVLRMDVLQRLEALGVPVVNSSRAMEACVDKYLASARLAAAGLPTPPTAACENREEAMRAFEALGRDVVLKPLFGAEGKGISRISDPDLAYRAFQLLEQQGGVIYLQRYIPHDGSDLRVFVLGGRVLAAMRRRAQDTWRTNLSLGGRAEPVELTEEQCNLAVTAATTLGAAAAGVDLLPSEDGYCYVLEVNAIPGWRGLVEATGVDIAAELLRFVVRQEP